MRRNCLFLPLPIVIAIAVAVTISVAIGMGVAVSALVVAGAVEDEGHAGVFLLLIEAVELGEHGALKEACADDEEGPVGVPVDDLGVGHDLDGRTVDEDVVIPGPQPGHQLREPRGLEQLGRVRGDGADGKEVERRALLVGHDERGDVRAGHAQVVRQATVGRADVGRGRAVAHVAVDDEHLPPLERQRHGEVHRDERLARAGVE